MPPERHFQFERRVTPTLKKEIAAIEREFVANPATTLNWFIEAHRRKQFPWSFVAQTLLDWLKRSPEAIVPTIEWADARYARMETQGRTLGTSWVMQFAARVRSNASKSLVNNVRANFKADFNGTLELLATLVMRTTWSREDVVKFVVRCAEDGTIDNPRLRGWCIEHTKVRRRVDVENGVYNLAEEIMKWLNKDEK